MYDPVISLLQQHALEQQLSKSSPETLRLFQGIHEVKAIFYNIHEGHYLTFSLSSQEYIVVFQRLRYI